MAHGFEVDVLALRQAAEGIGRTVDAVRTRPLDPGAAPDLGHARLAEATAEFLSRWQLGVENLAEDGAMLGSSLLAAAQAYEQLDTGGARSFTGVVSAETGPDPGPR